MKNSIIELILAYGWLRIESGNFWTESFRKEETKERLNYYFTTGTVVVQTIDGQWSVWRLVDLEKIEEILNKFR